jgi:3-oxoacyl-[acyl-carrier-protein] synthase-3
VLQATDREEGLLGEHLGCYADARHTLRVRGMGCVYANRSVLYGDTQWDFDGQEIFRHAVQGMTHASAAALSRCGINADQIDLVVPHQANRRIIDAVIARAGIPQDRVMLTVQRYGNMSSATVPVALVDALEEGRVRPNALILMPAFGAGLTLCAHVVRWGDRVTPLASSDAGLPACPHTALELVAAIRACKAGARERSGSGLNSAPLVDQT